MIKTRIKIVKKIYKTQNHKVKINKIKQKP